MIILPFDTETTGIPDWKAPSEDPNQPHIVQLAAILADNNGKQIASINNVIVKPDGWIIPPGMVHGITHEQAMDVGIPEVDVLDMFIDFYRKCSLRVAHNTTFDNRIIRIALKRYHPDLISDDEWKDKAFYFCTMLEYSKVYGGKWPKLEEAYKHLTGKVLEGAHTAMADTLACLEIYLALNGKQQGELQQ